MFSFDTYYNSYSTFKLNTLKNLSLDLLRIKRYYWFLNSYVLQGSVAT